jgi:hypothetical protein
MKAITLSLSALLLLAWSVDSDAARRGLASRKARAKATGAAVAIAQTVKKTKVRKLHAMVRKELQKRGIKVKRRPVPRKLTRRRAKRRMVAYARAHRLARIYEVRVRATAGDELVVSLSEKKAPKMRRAYSAKLPIRDLEQLDEVVPRLVEAVVERKEPRVTKSVKVAGAMQSQEVPSTEQTVQAAPDAPVEAPEGEVRSQWLWGFSLQPGVLMVSPVGMFGGSGQLYYQRNNLRFGVEVGGMGGGGTLVNITARAQYLYELTPQITAVGGGGLSYTMMENGEFDGSGGSASITLGAQLARFSWALLVAEAEFVLPFFSIVRDGFEFNNGITSIVNEKAYTPAAMFKLSCLF